MMVLVWMVFYGYHIYGYLVIYMEFIWSLYGVLYGAFVGVCMVVYMEYERYMDFILKAYLEFIWLFTWQLNWWAIWCLHKY